MSCAVVSHVQDRVASVLARRGSHWACKSSCPPFPESAQGHRSLQGPARGQEVSCSTSYTVQSMSDSLGTMWHQPDFGLACYSGTPMHGLKRIGKPNRYARKQPSIPSNLCQHILTYIQAKDGVFMGALGHPLSSTSWM